MTHTADRAVAAPVHPELRIALLTGGDDRSYVIGLTSALVQEEVFVDVIGSDRVDAPELRGSQSIRFLNLRGDQREDVRLHLKVIRILRYYVRLLRYAVVAQPRLFHILWNNKFEYFDRTILTAWYRMWGRRVVLTAHNVNAARRDGRDTWMNRLSLRIQYHLVDQLFVHSERMKSDLMTEFGVGDDVVTVIPFGINETIAQTSLSRAEARQILRLEDDQQVILFFGQIARYKGLDYLVEAFAGAARHNQRLRLVVAGKVKRGEEEYWGRVDAAMRRSGAYERMRIHAGFIPDSEVEPFFKAADVVVLPYVEIFQSGVPFLAFHFGVPVIATDVGALSETVIHGTTGFLCFPRDPDALRNAIENYFRSELYTQLEGNRERIRGVAADRHSWTKVAQTTRSVYDSVLSRDASREGRWIQRRTGARS